MFLKQHDFGCPAHTSSLIDDEQSRRALVVDPQHDIEQNLDDATQHDVPIRRQHDTMYPSAVLTDAILCIGDGDWPELAVALDVLPLQTARTA